MLRKLMAILLMVIMFTCLMPVAVLAEVTPPTKLGAPEHFAAGHYYADQIYFTISAPEDLRDYIERRADDDPVNKQSFSAHCQFDYKIDNGSWHYTKDWDSLAVTHKNILYVQMVNDKSYLATYGRESISALFPEDPQLKAFAEEGWDYLKSHKITFRARFAESFDYGKTNVISDWSNEYIFSANLNADTDKMINHAPTLITADLKTASNGVPYFDIKSDRIPGEIMDLHGMSSGNARTEIWMRKLEDKDFMLIKQDWANLELFNIDAEDYFSGKEQSYDAQSYEIKIRYALDLRNYKQAGIESSTGVYIYSPFSNVISHNMPAWSNASGWATAEVKKALDNGLYPDKLKGADLTKSITRAEFAAVALKLYESLSGKTASPAPTSTFTDTRDSDVLKAYALDIVAGVGNNKFAPDELLNREQAATMLTRVYKKVNWEGWTLAGDNAYTKHSLDSKGVTQFDDDAQISGYAKPSVYFMAKYGIIKGGGNNKFAPRNTTSAEAAAGYANATREQALAISNRTFENVDDIQDGGPIAATPPAQTTPTTPPAQTLPPKGNEGNTAQGEGLTSDDLIGEWSRGGAYSADYVSGNINVGTMSIVNGEYYKFNTDGTFRSVISTLGGYVGSVQHESMIVYETGKYKIDGNKIIFSDRAQTYYKGTPLVLAYKDKKMNNSDELLIEEFDQAGKRFKTMMGWLEKRR